MRKEQPRLVLVIIGLLVAPLLVAGVCGDKCSLNGQITIHHLFYALMFILACMLVIKLYIIMLFIQDANERAQRIKE